MSHPILKKINFCFERTEEIPVDIGPDPSIYDKWIITLTYKGKTSESTYVTNKGEFVEPRLDMFLNTLFSSSMVYRHYKNDYFKFARVFGGGVGYDPDRIQNLFQSTENAHDQLLDLFGYDFSKYDKYFRSLRPIDEVLK